MNRNLIVAAVVVALVVAAYFLAEGRWAGPVVVLAAALLVLFTAGRERGDGEVSSSANQ